MVRVNSIRVRWLSLKEFCLDFYFPHRVPDRVGDGVFRVLYFLCYNLIQMIQKVQHWKELDQALACGNKNPNKTP